MDVLSGAECSIHVNGGLPAAEPILLHDGDSLAFWEPNNDDAVELAAGERVRMVCSGKGNYFQFNKTTSDIVAECVEDTTFSVLGREVQVHQLGCKAMSYNDARRAGTCLGGLHTRINIGFQVGDGFITQIENCFDETTLDAVYSRMNMTPGIAGHESGVKRPAFTPSSFYEDINPNALFKSQQDTVGKLLGDPELGKKYVQSANSGNRFLARGHLSAKADYVLGAQQRATFYYVNAAPQWQTFNGGNWNKLEAGVRDYVAQSNKAVQVRRSTLLPSQKWCV